MSIHESNVLKTSNSLLMNQNRAEFLEKFQGQNNNYKPTDNNQKGRWNQLYNHSKLRKMKEEVYRKKAIEVREN